MNEMNGYPNWTPASEFPKSEGWYFVTRKSGEVDWEMLYDATDSPWWGTSERDPVIAWMPFPPAYDPPKFGWHNTKNDSPKEVGVYLIAFNVDDGVCRRVAFYNIEHRSWMGVDNGKVVWWSYIEPVPANLKGE